MKKWCVSESYWHLYPPSREGASSFKAIKTDYLLMFEAQNYSEAQKIADTYVKSYKTNQKDSYISFGRYFGG